jgi:hypothetical protein
MKIERSRYSVDEPDCADKLDEFEGAPRRIRIPHTPTTGTQPRRVEIKRGEAVNRPVWSHQ